MNWVRYQEEQAKIEADLFKIEKLAKKLHVVKEQIEHAEVEAKYYEHELQKARKRAKQFDSFSFVNMWRTWKGNHDELRAQAIDETAVIELKLDEMKKIVSDLTNDQHSIETAIQKLDELKLRGKLHLLVPKKKEWLRVNAPLLTERLEQASKNETKAKQYLVEIEEAKEAGEAVIEILYETQKSLNSASSYSTWDTFFGGGIVATHMKHEKLRESENNLHSIQMALQRFHNELMDVQEFKTTALKVDIDGFVRFADYVLDDIFSAWSIHSKIATSKRKLSGVIDDVNNTLSKLNQKKVNVLIELERYQEEKGKILEMDKKKLYL